MSKHVLLSVIIPVFNKAKTLSASVESVLKAETDNIELLLIDDGSTDDSGKICDKYALNDKRVKVFHKTNGGVSSARNLGIDNASGDYVYFCDADDEVVSNTLAAGIKVIESINADIFIFDFQYNVLDSKSTSKSSFILPERKILEKNEIVENMLSPLVLKNATDLAPLWHKFFSSKVIKSNNLRFEEKVHKGEDWRFNLDFLDAAKTAYYVPQILYVYTIDGTQTETKYKKEPSVHLLGSVKRKFYLNEKYSFGADRNLILLWCKEVFDDVIYSAKETNDKFEIKKLLNDGIVKKAIHILKKTKKEELHAAEVSRKYKVYAHFICLKSRFLLKNFAKKQ